MRMFDYMYYRIAKFYYKKDGIDAMGAVIILSLVQASLIGELIAIVLRYFYSRIEITNYNLPLKASTIGMIVFIAFTIFNYFRYKGRYWRFSDKWREEEKNNSLIMVFRGWLVILAIVAPIVTLILMGTFFGRN